LFLGIEDELVAAALDLAAAECLLFFEAEIEAKKFKAMAGGLTPSDAGNDQIDFNDPDVL
jgi:hypothetical protein